MLGFVRRNLRVNSKSAREKAYKMLVRPKVEYAATVWDPHTKEQVSKIERIQRRAARVVANNHHKTSSVTKMLKELNWPSLEDRRKAARLTTLYKIRQGVVKVSTEHLKPAPSRSRRGHDQQFTRYQSKKDVRLYSFFPRTVGDCYKLSQDDVSAPSADAFHRRILRPAC